MGYRIRVLGTNTDQISLDLLREAARPAVIEVDNGVDDSWEALVVKHDGGDPIAFVEKNMVVEGELGAEEIEEFISELSYYKPDSAASWLRNYLPNVKVIYSLQLLSGVYDGDGWTPLHAVQGRIWKSAGGILQADGEGFSNEEGFTVLWQFDESTVGPWHCAVLGEDGKWTNFEMDLGNKLQREAFQHGEVPSGAKVL